jgi:hypothetical protein
MVVSTVCKSASAKGESGALGGGGSHGRRAGRGYGREIGAGERGCNKRQMTVGGGRPTFR